MSHKIDLELENSTRATWQSCSRVTLNINNVIKSNLHTIREVKRGYANTIVWRSTTAYFIQSQLASANFYFLSVFAPESSRSWTSV